MTSFAAKLVSSKFCFYHEIFFTTGTRVSWKNEKSAMLSELSVLIGRSVLCFLATGDIGPVYSTATFPATVWSQFKLDLKERDNKRNKTRAAAADLLPNESHATANVSLLAC